MVLYPNKLPESERVCSGICIAEKKRTNKWLAEQLGKDPGTVSKWCTNTMQPNLETLAKIAKILEVDIRDLLWPIKD